MAKKIFKEEKVDCPLISSTLLDFRCLHSLNLMSLKFYKNTISLYYVQRGWGNSCLVNYKMNLQFTSLNTDWAPIDHQFMCMCLCWKTIK